MTAADRRETSDIGTAMAAAGAMIAFQVAGRATRDALFLSNFPVTGLPLMVAAAAIASLLSAFGVGGVLRRWGPARFVPSLFAASAAALLVEFALLRIAPRAAAVAVYIHFVAVGALLVSSFWSLLNERFDPRTAKRAVSRIGATATLGGVGGGLLAERVAAGLSVGAMLPLLAAMHVACALLTLRIGAGGHRPAGPRPQPGTEGPLRVLAGSSYLRTLAAIVVVSTVSEGLLDFNLKAAAQGAYGDGDALLRFFAVFYTGVNLLGAALQAAAGRRALERLGLARTVGMLPWTVAVGGAGALALPGLGGALLAKGSEAIVRNSLYRSGYELLFTPLPQAEKREVKAFVDVGAVRVGDLFAAGLVQTLLVLSALHAPTLMLLLAMGAAAIGIALSLRIHRGYVATLERNLLDQAIELELEDVADGTTRLTLERTGLMHGAAQARRAGGAPRVTPFEELDPVVERLRALRSGDSRRVVEALGAGPLAPEHVPQAVTLLAWDAVTREAVTALGAVARHHAGQMVDALLRPETEFAIRRRLPAALARAGTQRAFDGLLEGLNDRRFEVRYRCGRALARMRSQGSDLRVTAERVYAAVMREADTDRGVWEGQRLLEREDDDPLELGAALKDRASRSLEHVFTVLSLVLPAQPLQIAFRGLHTSDPQLRGTALEYLETALPSEVRKRLWPFLDDSPARQRSDRSPAQVAADLMESSESIEIHLAARLGGETD